VKFHINHRTVYHYSEVVSSSYGLVHLLPRDAVGQICHDAEVTIEPVPEEQREHRDFFGNRVTYFEILSSHQDLAVTATSIVEVDGRQMSLPLLMNQAWEEARITDRSNPENLQATQYVLSTELAPGSEALRAYASSSFPPRRPVLEALTSLADRIHDDFAYKPGVTSVTTTADEVLAGREGVCQDFAHVAIGCLRALGLAARYVSGYLETDAPDGQPRLQGADVSHAWASVYVPRAGWVDVDPTNSRLVNDRYITAAWGRDYRDVPPIKGVIYTDGTKHELEVSVDVARGEEM
jgi:transglutaminase-like putative cysteine protease